MMDCTDRKQDRSAQLMDYADRKTAHNSNMLILYAK